MKTDTRTIVLAADGRFVTLGRHSEPSDAELAQVTATLAATGVTAWLATMHGSPHGKRAPKITAIRGLHGEGDFAAAVAACHAGVAAYHAALNVR